MNKVSKLLASFALVALGSAANAGTITIGGPAVTGSDRFEDFDIGVSVAGVTNQFAGNGLTFTTLSGAGISLIRDSSCSNSGGSGVSGEYLYMGVIPECSGNNTEDGVSIQFDTTVTDLSWTGFNVASATGFNVDALLDGIVVSSTVFNNTNVFYNDTTSVRFSGSDFNEIQFRENGNGTFFAVDNMAWNITAVPAPAPLALFGLGLLVLGIRRKYT